MNYQVKEFTFIATLKKGDEYVKSGVVVDVAPGADFDKVVEQVKKDVLGAAGVNNGTSASAAVSNDAGVAEEAPAKPAKAAGRPAKEAGAAPKSDAKPGKATKVTAPKDVPYDRAVKEHADQFRHILGEEFPGWKENPELKKKAGELSQTFTAEKTPFVDAEGNVLSSFVEALCNAMNEDNGASDDV